MKLPNGNGLHSDTPWAWVMAYRLIVLFSTLAMLFHQVQAHQLPPCPTLPLVG